MCSKLEHTHTIAAEPVRGSEVMAFSSYSLCKREVQCVQNTSENALFYALLTGEDSSMVHGPRILSRKGPPEDV